MKADKILFAETEGIIEATSYEHMCLWDKFEDKDNWSDASMGVARQIGEIGGKPITLSLRWSLINNKRILFWEACSQAVDYATIDEWFDENFPRIQRRTNAMNAHIAGIYK